MGTDQLPDRLLERALRPEESVRETDACLDAETLAAWVDGTLPAQERTVAERHAADCSRCLEMLATLAKTEPAPTIAEPRAWHRWRWVAPLATASIVITAWLLVRDAAVPEMPQGFGPAAQPSARSSEAPGDVRPRQQQGAGAPAEPLAPGTPPLPIAPERRATRRADDPAMAKALDTAAGERNERVLASPPMTTAARQDAAASARFRADSATIIVTSSDPNIVWRLLGAVVERSTDGGKTWQQQTTGTSAVLTAGSCPSSTTCWIVGVGGTVLLTTDGESWRRVPFPDTQSTLADVSARNGRQATVTTTDGRTYVTTDGGLRWRLQDHASPSF